MWCRVLALLGGLLVGCSSASVTGDDLEIRLPPRSAADQTSPSAPPPTGDVAPSSQGPSDAGAADATATVDAAPTTQTFTLGSSDCNGGHCSGGYDGVKDDKNLPTATKQCVDRSFTRATSFTIGGSPGGRFCSYNGTAYGCDSSCSGCNLMTTVTCSRP